MLQAQVNVHLLFQFSVNFAFPEHKSHRGHRIQRAETMYSGDARKYNRSRNRRANVRRRADAVALSR
jgi:hypothetical protein